MDLSSNLAQTPFYIIAWLSFLAGIGGSLHCVAMCGGLASTCTPTTQSNVTYQLGRLLGYASLGFLAGLINYFVTIPISSPWINVVPALLIGGLFIYWGYKIWKGRSLHFELPGFIKKITSKAWASSLKLKSPQLRASLVGLLSIFLPCGLLYGVVLSLSTLQNPLVGALGMGCFWLGTIPAMTLAPNLLQRILRPILAGSPKTVSLMLITLGIATITYRMVDWYGSKSIICD